MVEITVKKCYSSSHDTLNNFYCKICLELFCDICALHHNGHDTCSLDDIKSQLTQEFLQYNSDLKNSIEEKNKLKIDNIEIFNKQVETKFNQETDSVTEQFRNLHDLLHFKEVELKRELKSFQETNLETFTTTMSKLEYETLQLTNYLQNQTNTDSSNNNDVGGIADKVDQNEEKLKLFVNERHQQKTNAQLERDQNKTIDTYQVHVFIGDQGTEEINSISLNRGRSVKEKVDSKSNAIEKKEKYIIFFNKFGIEKAIIHGTVIGKPEVVLKNDPLSPTPLLYFWNETMVESKMYLFGSECVNYIDLNDEKPKWGSIPFKSKSADLSAIYDGKDHIYVFNGHSGENMDTNIRKLNINTNEPSVVSEDFQNLSYLNLRYHDNCIYMIGGYSQKQSWSNYIQRLDLTNNKIENIAPYSHSIAGGCYVPDLDSFFYYTWSTTFYKYDCATKSVVPLSQPYESTANYSKLYFDGDDTIFMVSSGSKILYIYSISGNTWKNYKLKFKEKLETSSFFVIVDV